jgi:hypothetical protein
MFGGRKGSMTAVYCGITMGCEAILVAFSAAGLTGLKHDPEKWTSGFPKDHAPIRNLDPDPIQSNRIKV